jgi:hypothetical protein
VLARLAVLAAWGPIAASGGSAAVITALLGSHHAVSVQADRGHDDLVFCHDEGGVAPAPAAAIAASDCADDHRVHVANADRLVSRADAKLVDARVAPASLALPNLAAVSHAATPASALALPAAITQQRTVVLQV